MCELTQISQAGYYRFLRGSTPQPEVIELRHQIQQIALQSPVYGSRRITAELQRRGQPVNRKRVQRRMREDNLLCLRKRRFVVSTTDSKHGMPVYPNRAASMILSGCNQLWLADITYVRLFCEFVYLAVILDAYSRRVIGWALERTLEDRLSLAALQMAVSRRPVREGLVHHSDRGCAAIDHVAGASMSLPRHGEIYPYDEGTTRMDRASAHRLDESPAGYSWRVALQHGPLPLHQLAPCCNQNQYRSTRKQRTENRGLTSSISRGVHCNLNESRIM